MALIRWEPLRDIERLLEESWQPSFNNFGWDLAADVYEQDGQIVAQMNLPGIDPEKIDISFDDDQHLRISGNREDEQLTEDKNFFSREIRRGSFERIIRLPQAVDSKKTEANYQDGVLQVTMPAKDPANQERVKVKVNKK